MPRLILRLTAVVLVPCLLAGPLVPARAGASLIPVTSVQKSVAVFNRQALSAAAGSYTRHWIFRRVGILFFGWAKRAQQRPAMDRAMLGDLLDQPGVRAALPEVKAVVRQPENLSHGVAVYRHSPVLFKHLADTHIAESVIENIGHALGHNTEGAKSALEAGLPFSAPWLPRRSVGMAAMTPLLDLFAEHPNLAARLLEKGWLGYVDHLAFFRAVRSFWPETLELIEQRHWSPTDPRLWEVAQALHRRPVQTRQVLDFFGAQPPSARIDGDMIAGCALLMQERNVTVERLVKLIRSLGLQSWHAARLHSGTDGAFTEKYLVPFLEDEREARRQHRQAPFNDSWVFNWRARMTPAGQDLLAQGFPLALLYPGVVAAYDANAAAFEILWRRTSPKIAATTVAAVNKVPHRVIHLMLERLAAATWLAPDLDQFVAKYYLDHLLARGGAVSKGYRWASERVQEGVLSSHQFSIIADAFDIYPEGVIAARAAGVSLEDMRSPTAKLFEDGAETAVAQMFLGLYPRYRDLSTWLVLAIAQSPTVVGLLEQAGIPLADLDHPVVMLEWEHQPQRIQAFIPLLRIQGRSAAELGFRKSPFDFTARVSFFPKNRARLELSLAPQELEFLYAQKRVRGLGKHTAKPAAAYVLFTSIEGRWVVSEIQSDLLDGKLSGPLEERYRDAYAMVLKVLEHALRGSTLLIHPPPHVLGKWSALHPKTAYRLYSELPATLGYRMERFPDVAAADDARLVPHQPADPWFWAKTPPLPKTAGRRPFRWLGNRFQRMIHAAA